MCRDGSCGHFTTDDEEQTPKVRVDDLLSRLFGLTDFHIIVIGHPHENESEPEEVKKD